MKQEKIRKEPAHTHLLGNINIILLTLLLSRVVLYYYDNETMALSVTLGNQQLGDQAGYSFFQHGRRKTSLKYAKITIRIDEYLQHDSLFMNVYDLPITANYKDLNHTIKLVAHPDKSLNFHFMITDAFPVRYISIGDSSLAKILDYYLIEPGDDITIHLKKKATGNGRFGEPKTKWNDGYFASFYAYYGYDFLFSGKGSEKFFCKYKLDSAGATDNSEGTFYNNVTKAFSTKYHADESKKKCLSILNNYQKRLSPLSYNTLKADVIGKYNNDWINDFYFFYNYLGVTKNDTQFISRCKEQLYKKTKLTAKETIPIGYARYYSLYYINAIATQERIKYRVFNENSDSAYYGLKSKWSGRELEKMLLSYLINYFQWTNTKTGNEQLDDASTIVQTTPLKAILESFRDAQNVGRKAFNFVLPNVNDSLINFKSFKGKVVFIDFWYTGCGACAEYYKTTLSKVEEEYKDDSQIVFITISIDKNKKQWQKSVNSGTYTSNDAINVFTGGMGTSHPLIEYYKVMGYPRPLLIGKDGKIFNSSDKDLRNLPSLKTEITAALNQQMTLATNDN